MLQPVQLIGTVHGTVLEERIDRQFWGGKLLLLVVIASFVLTLVLSWESLTAALWPLIVGGAVIAVLLAVVVGGIGGRASGVLGAIGRANAAIVSGAVGAATRAGAAGVSGSAGYLGRPGQLHTITLRRFRVVDLMGQTTSCVMLGELTGDVVRQGDLVRVHGRRSRDGHLDVRRVDLLDKPELPPRGVIRPRKPPAYGAAQAFDLAAKILAGVVAVYWLATFLAMRS